MKFKDLLELAQIAQSRDAVDSILRTDREICEMMGRVIIELFGESITCGFDSASSSPDGILIPEEWAGAPIKATDARTLVNSIMVAIDEVPSDAE